MEEKVITVGDQELVEVLIKAVHLQGLSSIQEYKNIDKVTHQVKTNKHIFPRSKIVKTTRHPIKFSKLRVKKTTAKLSKSRSKFLTLTKTQ